LIPRRPLFGGGHEAREAKMVSTTRRIAAAMLAALLAVSLVACKSPPRHTDSTKGTTRQDRGDTGMHGQR
jgi:hypothetical protein